MAASDLPCLNLRLWICRWRAAIEDLIERGTQYCRDAEAPDVASGENPRQTLARDSGSTQERGRLRVSLRRYLPTVWHTLCSSVCAVTSASTSCMHACLLLKIRRGLKRVEAQFCTHTRIRHGGAC